MKTSAFFILIYGLIVLIGGVAGYVMASSMPSLIFGGGFGIALIVTSYLTLQKKVFAPATSLVLILVLDAFFVYRFVKSGSFFPSGFMAVVSLLTVLLLSFSLRRELNKD